MCNYALVQTVLCLSPRVNPSVIYGLWLIKMYQGRFISFNKGTTPVGDVITGEAMNGIYGKFLYLSLDFVVNLKLL